MAAADKAMTYQRPAQHPLRGVLYIAIAAFLWGLSATMGRAAFTGLLAGSSGLKPLDPLILAQARTTFSFLLLAPALLIKRGPRALHMERGEVFRGLMLGVFGLAISNFAYYYSIQKTNVATAIVLQYTAPIWVLLYMVARRLQRATAMRVLAVLMAMVGSVLAIGVGSGQTLTLNVLGVVSAQAAAISFAFYNVYGHELVTRHDRWQVIVYAMLGAALFWIVVNPPWKVLSQGYTKEQWLFLLVFAITSMLLPFSFYIAGLQHLDATKAIVTSALEPVFAILLAATFIHEKLGWMQAVGVAIVLGATVLVQEQKHEELEHS